MTHVLMSTTWKEKCGIAEYAYNLSSHLTTDVQLSIVHCSEGWDATCNRALEIKADIVHFNYEPGILPWLTPGQVLHLRNIGKKTVLTLHTSREAANETSLTRCFDKVVVHEETRETRNGSNFVHIPHGIRVGPKTNIKNGYIVSAGFPFGWKNFPVVAQVAKNLGKRCLIIMPESGHVAYAPVKMQCLQAHPDCEFITDWMTQEETLRLMAECDCSVFAYGGANYGISGAVRFGIGAHRPTVISLCRQFHDLRKYDGYGIYLASGCSVAEIEQATRRALEVGSEATECIADMNWTKTAKQYEDLYRSL